MNLFIWFSVSLPLILACITTRAATIPPDQNATVPALVMFGDSIVDTGINNYIPTISRCNFSPYGKDFEGGKPTGRFSDGRVPSDLIAEALGIKPLLPPYLDPTLQPGDLLSGVNFASGASGWDPLTSDILKVLSLSDQLEMFKEYITKLKKIAGDERSTIIVRESLFAVFTGSNDITNTYFNTPLRRNYDVSSYIDLLVSFASTFVKDLYRLGARRIIVSGLPPIGCLPSQRTLRGGLKRKCVDKYNEIAELFNKKLSDQLASTNKQLSDARIFYVDVYNLLSDIIKSPKEYGFKVADKGCCGTGTLEVSIVCIYACRNVGDHVFWDSFHPTEKTYKLLVRQFLDQYLENNTCGKSFC